MGSLSDTVRYYRAIGLTCEDICSWLNQSFEVIWPLYANGEFLHFGSHDGPHITPF